MRSEYVELDIVIISFEESGDIITTSNCPEEFERYSIPGQT